MNGSKVGSWAIALFSVIVIMGAGVAYYDRLLQIDRKAAIETASLAAEVGRLQLLTNLFRRDARHPASSYSSWEESRQAFYRRFEEMSGHLPRSGTLHDRVSRLQFTLAHADDIRNSFVEDFTKVRNSPLADLITQVGMTAAYHQVLTTTRANDTDVANLGLSLARLADYQRSIQLAETDLTVLNQTLSTLGEQKLMHLRIAMGVAVLGLMCLVYFALRRITALHVELSRDHAAIEQGEQRLRASEADLRCMLDSIADAVIATDLQGRVTRMNPVACRLTGFTYEQASGQVLVDVLHASHEHSGIPLQSPIERALENGGRLVKDKALRIVSREGDEHLAELTATPIRGPKGTLQGVAVVFRDITEQARNEQRLRNDQRSDSIMKLASGVSHEVNNVLQVIRTNLAFAQDPRSGAEETADCLRQIDHATRKASDLTRKLLIFARKHPVRLSEGSVIKVIESCLPSLRKIAGERIKIDVDLPESAAPVRMDPRMMELALTCILENSAEAMPSGGVIRIEVSPFAFTQEEVHAYGWARPGQFVQIAISDNGPGMDEQAVQRACEPFYSTKALLQHSGLGLAVMQGIINQHEGLAQVFSEPARGTTVRLFLPYAYQEPVRRMLLPAPKDHSRTRLVLLADDDASLRSLMAGLLRKAGFAVRIACNGEEAKAIHQGTTETFDLAILDVMMPKLDGTSTARALKARQPGLPIMVCTGHGGAALEDQLRSEQGWTLISKPIDPEKFLLKVAELTRRT